MNPTTTTTSSSTAPAKRQVICGPTIVLQGSTSTSWQRRRPKPRRLRVLLPEKEEEEEDPSTTAEGQKKQKTNDDDEKYPSLATANAITTNTTENTVKDAYDFDQVQFLNRMYLRSNARPLPAISTMLAVAAQQQQQQQQQQQRDREDSSSSKTTKMKSALNDISKIPLLNNFFHSLRDKVGLEDSSGGDVDGGGDNDDEPSNHDNDNALNKLSTILTPGHHKRFKELLFELEKDGIYPGDRQRKRRAFRNQRARQKEFRKLCELFKEERNLYATAIETFKADNLDRFLTGFRISGPASDFVHVNTEIAQRWRKQWDDALKEDLVSNYYGPYTQAISLHEAGLQKNIDTIGLDTFNPRIVHRETDGLVKLKADWMDTLRQQKRLKPRVVAEPPSTFLCQDEMAKSLALKHNVDIVVTSSTLETLMKCPEDPNTSWKIPTLVVDVEGGVKSSGKLTLFMEDPLPRMSTPRECLSVGIREALIGQVASDAEIDCKRTQGKYTYTLIDVPHSTGGKQRILVRSCNYLIGEDDEPLIILSQLEYFSAECGMEEFGVYDSVLWLLFKILQDNSRIVVGRVDAISTEVIGAEEKTAADSLTDNDACVAEKFLDSLGCFERMGFDTNSSFRVMTTVLSAVQLIEKKFGARHVVCFPGQGDVSSSHVTATVHRAQNNKTNAVISVKEEVDSNAAAVLLTKSALYSCFNRWQWKFDRFPYTFPIEKD